MSARSLDGTGETPELPVQLPEPLAILAGYWDVEVDFLFMGTNEHQMAFGSATGAPMVGGRYLQLAIMTESEVVPVCKSIIVMCRDEDAEEYQSAHFDNTVTSIQTFRGEWDALAKVLTEEGEYSNPAFAVRHPLRARWDLSREDSVELEWTAPLGKDGEWMTVMRVVMNRADPR